VIVVVPTHVVPALGFVDTHVSPAPSVSVRTTLFAADSPLFLTVMLKVEFCPRSTALTLVETPMSAVLGLLEIALRE
jgi:hypothetical protein